MTERSIKEGELKINVYGCDFIIQPESYIVTIEKADEDIVLVKNKANLGIGYKRLLIAENNTENHRMNL